MDGWTTNSSTHPAKREILSVRDWGRHDGSICVVRPNLGARPAVDKMQLAIIASVGQGFIRYQRDTRLD